ncbi:MAG: hypothetical protein MK005_13960 [Alcanivorax sp.]|nr:hypothetical protein [Alcanivorax sp.]
MGVDSSGLGWRDEIRKVSVFIRHHWALLSLGPVSLSFAAMHVYLVEVGVPLSITSSEVIAGMPFLFMLIVCFIAVLIFAAVTPAVILLGGRYTKDIGIIDSFRAHNDVFLGRRLILFWSLSVLFATIISVSLAAWKDAVIFLGYHLVFISILLSYFCFQCIFIFFMQASEWVGILRKRWGSFLAAAFLQVMVMTGMIPVVGSIESAGVVSQFVILMGAMVLVSGFQAACVFLAWEAKNNPKLFLPVMAMLAFIVFFVCLVPPVNRVFVGYALSNAAMGGRSCVVFGWNKNAEVLPSIIKDKNIDKSIGLKVLMSTAEVFYARPAAKERTDEIFLIPREAVVTVSSCKI